MKKDLKKKWTNALRSGEYVQGSQALCDTEYDCKTHKESDVFCCLGVLCALNGTKPNKIKLLKGPDGEYNQMLSPRLLNKYGLTDDQQEKLAEMNDEGKSFHTIARWIEKHV